MQASNDGGTSRRARPTNMSGKPSEDMTLMMARVSSEAKTRRTEEAQSQTSRRLGARPHSRPLTGHTTIGANGTLPFDPLGTVGHSIGMHANGRGRRLPRSIRKLVSIVTPRRDDKN
jgi:hypothetical protein